MKAILYSIVLSFVLVSAQAQRASYFKRIFVDAEYFLLYEDYLDALPLYQELYNAFPNNANIAYRLGLCYFNLPNEKHKAIPFLERAINNISENYREGFFTESQAPREALLYYGKALRITYNFDNAVEVLNKYIGLLKDHDTNEKLLANLELNSIEYAKKLMANPINVNFTSAGRTVNSRFAEINPVVSADNNVMVYTSVQQFYNAILLSQRRANVWTHPINLNSQMFADGPISTVGISADGRTLLLARNDNDVYNLYTSAYDTIKNSWGVITRLPREINTRSWENYATFSPSGDTLYFSSNRPGGAGGFDIYMSTRTFTGWSEARNLGDVINTPFDEIAPSISRDGKKMFFASKGHKTMGGFDIFVSQLKNGRWTKPINLGYPFNTTDDDVFFQPMGDGTKGYISRLMPQSYGETDIYFVEFENRAFDQNWPNDKNQNSSPVTIDKLGQEYSYKPNPLIIP